MGLGTIDRIVAALGCLAGLLGVAASAAAAHIAGADSLKTAAQFLLFHAPLVVGLVALGAVGIAHSLATRLAALAILAGLALFPGDLALRAVHGTPLFPYAAPAGGFALIAGWLVTALAGVLRRRR